MIELDLAHGVSRSTVGMLWIVPGQCSGDVAVLLLQGYSEVPLNIFSWKLRRYLKYRPAGSYYNIKHVLDFLSSVLPPKSVAASERPEKNIISSQCDKYFYSKILMISVSEL